MPGRGPQTFKKRQKEQQRKEKQQEKMTRRLARKDETVTGSGDEETSTDLTSQDVPTETPEANADM